MLWGARGVCGVQEARKTQAVSSPPPSQGSVPARVSGSTLLAAFKTAVFRAPFVTLLEDDQRSATGEDGYETTGGVVSAARGPRARRGDAGGGRRQGPDGQRDLQRLSVQLQQPRRALAGHGRRLRGRRRRRDRG